MSAFTPTAAQRAAIESRGSAVLVSAGAGSGKTKVLTERLMGYLTDRTNPKDIDSFLVITFTRAAAGELKGRIMDELSKAIAADPSNRHLRRQSALCRRAEISTIHGFCGTLLRRHGHLLGLAPDFRIIEDDRAAAMKSAALEKVMEDSYERAAAYPGFLALADTVGAGRDDRRLCELVLELYDKMQCHARPEKWAEDMIEQLRAPAADAGETVWGREILASLQARADYWADEMDRVSASMAAEEKIRAAYGKSVGETADALRELSRALRVGWDCARERLPVPFPKLKVLRNSPNPALSDSVKARREACKTACKGMDKALAAPSETMLRGMALTHDAMEALLRLTLRFDAQYARDKRRLSLVDYSDLEHFAARLLTDESGAPTPLAAEVAARYTEVMVDEYQDVSRVQDTIFRAVSRAESNLFLVGDVKQSIYRFRLADPAIFTEKYDAYADYETAGDGAPRRILLRENFRSRREILSAANAVFSACMSRSLGDIDYDEAAALKYAAPYEGESRKPELLLSATEPWSRWMACGARQAGATWRSCCARPAARARPSARRCCAAASLWRPRRERSFSPRRRSPRSRACLRSSTTPTRISRCSRRCARRALAIRRTSCPLSAPPTATATCTARCAPAPRRTKRPARYWKSFPRCVTRRRT